MKIVLKISLVFFLFCFSARLVSANGLIDTDGDGVPDVDEINIYHTDPNNRDTDGDGYNDSIELIFGFSPHNREAVTLDFNDYDQDGLTDRMELNFGTDLSQADTDGDGYTDGDEVLHAYDPLNRAVVKLEKRIEIDTTNQKMSNFLGGVRMNTYIISSGVNNSTPRGHYTVVNKNPKAWSSYGLWMPWWMGLDRGGIGIHELPVWPSGYVEGEDHLGKPVSHGCIRLGKVNSEYLYEWTPIGTKVFIY